MGSDDTEPEEHPTAAALPRNRGSRPSLDNSRYRLGDVLGRGGMGEVVAAQDTTLGREVAIKRLLEEQPSAELEARFMREAQVQGRLDHPSIPPVYEVGHDGARCPYIVMKRLSGITLAEIINQVEAGSIPYPREKLLRAFIDVCLAMELAHTRGVVHRDLKPSNIMLGEFGEVYVLDWGVAKVLTESGRRLPTPRPDETQAGTIIGTPVYMAPEQRDGSPDVDGRADVYALGRMLCEILSGKRMRKPVGKDAERRPSSYAPFVEVAPELDELCVAATDPEPRDRIASARELADRVQSFLDGDRDLALRRKLALAHLEEAQTRYDRDTSRANALREAGRALALDPTLTAAADLVGRLMLETPKTLPAEVKRSLADVDLAAIRRAGRVGVIAYLCYLVFVPALAAIGMRSVGYLVALVVNALALAISAWAGIRWPTARWRVPVMIVGNFVMVAIFARMFTPFMIAPGIAAVTALVIFRNPLFRGRWMVPTIVALALGVALPWLAERLGWLTPTHTFVGGGVLLRSFVIEMRPIGLGIGLIFYASAIVTVAALISHIHARAQRQAEQQLHLHAWRLRQLVPEPA